MTVARMKGVRPDLQAGADIRVQGRQGGIPPGAKGEAVVTRLLRGIGLRIDLESIAPRPSVNATGHPSQPSCPRDAWRPVPIVEAAPRPLLRIIARDAAVLASPAGRWPIGALRPRSRSPWNIHERCVISATQREHIILDLAVVGSCDLHRRGGRQYCSRRVLS